MNGLGLAAAGLAPALRHALAAAQQAEVDQQALLASTWWHGGPRVRGDRLEPQPEDRTRSGLPDGYVYVTTDRSLAEVYAASVDGTAWVYQVEPDGLPEPDPGTMRPDISFRCTGATIVRRFTLSNRERARMAAAQRRVLGL